MKDGGPGQRGGLIEELGYRMTRAARCKSTQVSISRSLQLRQKRQASPGPIGKARSEDGGAILTGAILTYRDRFFPAGFTNPRGAWKLPQPTAACSNRSSGGGLVPSFRSEK